MIADQQRSIEVVSVGGVSGTDATPLLMQGWLELHQGGIGDGECIGANLNALVAYAPNGRDMLPVGVMAFKIGTSCVWLDLAYVIPDFRGRRIFTAMWSTLTSLVAEKMPSTIRSIEYEAHINNKTMRAVAQRMGHRETAVMMKVDINR